MSLFKSIGKVLKSVAKPVLGAVGGFLTGRPAGAIAGGISGLGIGGGGGALTMPNIPSAPSIATPSIVPGFPGLPSMGIPGPTTPGASAMAMLGAGALAGKGGRGFTKTKMGRLSGGMIPVGYHERMSPQGVIYLAKTRRRRGLSYRDISNFRRVDRLLSRYARRGITRGRK